MKDVVYVTSNEHKARYFSKLIGFPIEHASADIKEIQSLDQAEIVTEKAKAAFKQLKRSVLIEDTSLSITILNRLQGTFIKWFIDEIGLEKVCRLADSDPARSAIASCVFAYYDGHNLKLFKGQSHGTIAETPRGDAGFGFNPIFIPDNSKKTMGEMNEKEFTEAYLKIKPIKAAGDFLDKQTA